MNSSDFSLSALKKMMLEEETAQQLLPSLENDSRAGAQQLLKQYYRKQKALQKAKEDFIIRSKFERQLYDQGYRYIAGIDEVGRGPLAGPVVASAVILKPDCQLYQLNDSKKLSATVREELYEQIQDEAGAIGIGICDEAVIDEYNIYEATKIAMKKAIDQLAIPADYLLLDAMTLDVPTPQEKLIHGDARSISIAAASIIAKVTRDRMMVDYARDYPYYDFEHNMGYGTKAHLEGLEKHGICPIHRRSFEPIKSQYQ